MCFLTCRIFPTELSKCHPQNLRALSDQPPRLPLGSPTSGPCAGLEAWGHQGSGGGLALACPRLQVVGTQRPGEVLVLSRGRFTWVFSFLGNGLFIFIGPPTMLGGSPGVNFRVTEPRQHT